MGSLQQSGRLKAQSKCPRCSPIVAAPRAVRKTTKWQVMTSVPIRFAKTEFPAVLSAWEARILAAMLALSALRLWISPLRSSFWIDETGTAWTIKGGFSDLLHHLGNHLFPQTSVYAVMMWGWSQVAGFSEASLRLPSVLASAASAVLFYGLGKKLVGSTASLYAVLLLITLPHISYTASDARPYAWAILTLVWTFYERVKWIESGRVSNALLYGIGCGLTVDFSFFFGAALAGDLVYLAVAHRRKGRRFPKTMALSYAAALIVMLPSVRTLLPVIDRLALHIVVPAPNLTDFALALVPPRWILAALFGTAIAWLMGAGRFTAVFNSGQHVFLMLALWAFSPPTLLFLYSVTGHHSLFLPRYYLSAAPGAALLGGYLLASMQPAAWRLTIVTIVTALSLATQGLGFWTAHDLEDWRGGSAVIREIRAESPRIPVLAVSSFTESRLLPMPAPAAADYSFLSSPFTAYPIPGDAPVLLPIQITPENKAYTESVIDSAVAQGRFLMSMPANSPMLPWLNGRLHKGFEFHKLHANPVVLDIRAEQQLVRDEPTPQD